MPAKQGRKMSRMFVLVVVLLCPFVDSVSNGVEPAFVQNSPQMLHPTTQQGGGMRRSASQVFRPKVQENAGKDQVKMSASGNEPGETKEVLEESVRRRNEEEYAKTGIAFLIGTMNAFFHRVVVAFSDAVGMKQPDSKRKFKRVVHAGHNVATTLSRGQSSAEIEEILARLKKMEDDKLSTAPTRASSARSGYSLPSFPGSGRAPTKIKVVSRMEEDEVQRVLEQTRMMTEERELTEDESIVTRMRRKSGSSVVSDASKGSSPPAERVPPQEIRSADITRVGEDASRMTSEGSPSREGSLASQQPQQGAPQPQPPPPQSSPQTRERTGAAAVTAVLAAPRAAPTEPTRVVETAQPPPAGDVQVMREAAERMLGSVPGSRPPADQQRKTYNLMAPEWGKGPGERRGGETAVRGEEGPAGELGEERREKSPGRREELGMAFERAKAKVKGKIDTVLAPFSPDRGSAAAEPPRKDAGHERRASSLAGPGSERVSSRSVEEDVQSVLASVQHMMGAKGSIAEGPAAVEKSNREYNLQEPTGRKKEYVMMGGLDPTYRPSPSASPSPATPTAASAAAVASAPSAPVQAAPSTVQSVVSDAAPLGKEEAAAPVSSKRGKIEFVVQSVLSSVQNMMSARGLATLEPAVVEKSNREYNLMAPAARKKEYVMMGGLDPTYRPSPSPPASASASAAMGSASAVASAPSAPVQAAPSTVQSVVSDAAPLGKEEAAAPVSSKRGKIEFVVQSVLSSVQNMMSARGLATLEPAVVEKSNREYNLMAPAARKKEYVMMGGLDPTYRPSPSPPASASASAAMGSASAVASAPSAPVQAAPSTVQSVVSDAAPLGKEEAAAPVSSKRGKIEFVVQSVLSSVQNMMSARGLATLEPAVVEKSNREYNLMAPAARKKEYVMMGGLDPTYRPSPSPPASTSAPASVSAASAPSWAPSADEQRAAPAAPVSASKGSRENAFGTALASAKEKIEYALFGGARPERASPEPSSTDAGRAPAQISSASSTSDDVRSIAADAQRMTAGSAPAAPQQISPVGQAAAGNPLGGPASKKDYVMMGGLDASRRAEPASASASASAAPLPAVSDPIVKPPAPSSWVTASDDDVARILAEAQRRFEDQPLFPTPQHLEAVRGKLARLEARQAQSQSAAAAPVSLQTAHPPPPTATAPANSIPSNPPAASVTAPAPIASPVASAVSAPAAAAPVAGRVAMAAASSSPPASVRSAAAVAPAASQMGRKDYNLMGGWERKKEYSMMGGLDTSRRPSGSSVQASVAASAPAFAPSAPSPQPSPPSPSVRVTSKLEESGVQSVLSESQQLVSDSSTPPSVRSSSKSYHMMGGLDASRPASGGRRGSNKDYFMMGGLDASRPASLSSAPAVSSPVASAVSVPASAPAAAAPVAVKPVTVAAPPSSSPPSVRSSSKSYHMMGGLDASRPASGGRRGSNKDYFMMGGLDASRPASGSLSSAPAVSSPVASAVSVPASAPAAAAPVAGRVAMAAASSSPPASVRSAAAVAPAASQMGRKDYNLMGGWERKKEYSMMGGLDTSRRPSGSSVQASVAASAPAFAPSAPSPQPSPPSPSVRVTSKLEESGVQSVLSESQQLVSDSSTPPSVRSSSKSYHMMGGLDASRPASGGRRGSNKDYFMMGGLDASRPASLSSAPAVSSPVASAVSVPASAPTAAAPVAVKPVTVAAPPSSSPPSVRSSSKSYHMMGGLDASRPASGGRRGSNKDYFMMGGLDASRPASGSLSIAPAVSSPVASAVSVPASAPTAAAPVAGRVAMAAASSSPPASVRSAAAVAPAASQMGRKDYNLMGGWERKKEYSMMGGLDTSRRPSGSSVQASVAASAPAFAPSAPSPQPSPPSPSVRVTSKLEESGVQSVLSESQQLVSDSSTPPSVRSSSKSYHMMGGLDASRPASGGRRGSNKDYFMMGGLDASRPASLSSAPAVSSPVASAVSVPASAPAAAAPVAAPMAVKPVTVAAPPSSSPPSVRSSSKSYHMMDGLDASRPASGGRRGSNKDYFMMGGLDASRPASGSLSSAPAVSSPVASAVSVPASAPTAAAPVAGRVAMAAASSSPPASVRSAAAVAPAASQMGRKDYNLMGGWERKKEYSMMGGLDTSRRPSGSSVQASVAASAPAFAPSAPSPQPSPPSPSVRVTSKLEESGVQSVLSESQQLVSDSSTPPSVRSSSKSYHMMGGLDASRPASGGRRGSNKDYFMMGGLDASRRLSPSRASPSSPHPAVSSSTDVDRVKEDAARMAEVKTSRVLAEDDIQKILDNARFVAQEAGVHISEVRNGVSSL